MEIQKSGKKAVILGATGLVGSHLVSLLEENDAYEKIVVLARRSPDKDFGGRVEWHEDPMQDWDSLSPLIKGDDLFIALGTTIKKAGSREAFRRVDHDLVFHMAKAGALNGMSQLLLVTAVGADKDSSFFYNRVKGEVETAISALPFWAIHILRPSMLLGDRKESRPAEFLAQKIFSGVDSLLGSVMGKYRPVSGEQVARSMIHYAQQLQPGRFVHSSDEIYKFGSSQLLKVK